MFLAAPAYVLRFTGRVETLQPDMLFRYQTAISGVVVDGILLLIVLLIARGLPLRETFGLRPTPAWGRAAAIGIGTLVVAYTLAYAVVALFPSAVREQDVPVFWDGTRIGAWIANFFAIAIFAPIFEEFTFRGLGYSLLRPLGVGAAIVITAVAFTLAHGVVVDFPVIIATGVGLGFLRASTGSLYPCIALHTVFNAFAMALAALFGG